MKITHVCHACFVIEFDDLTVVTDPFAVDMRAAIIKTPAMRSPDVVIVTHLHGDHVGGLAAVAGNDTKVLSVVETANYLAQKGFDAVGLNFGGEATVGGVKFAVTQAIHTNSATENGKAVYGGLACGFVLAAEDKSVYFAGDTDVFSDMALIKEFYSPDIAILPVGGWYTMDVKKAVYACNRLLKPKYLIPMHFDTFPAIKADLSPLSCDLETAKAIILKDGDSADF